MYSVRGYNIHYFYYFLCLHYYFLLKKNINCIPYEYEINYILTVKYQKRLTPLLVIVQERVKTVQFCYYIINAIHISVLYSTTVLLIKLLNVVFYPFLIALKIMVM